MSWSASVGKTPAAEFEAAIDAAEIPATNFSSIAGNGKDEALEQLAAAKDAAKALFRSGVVGTEGEFAVSFGGHANPGHANVPGWGADSVYVNIYRVTIL